MHILVTGGCGFIGSNFIHYVLRQADNIKVTNIDCLTYAANKNNLRGLDRDRYWFYKLDISDPELGLDLEELSIDYIVNFAAESHVDNSIREALPFISSNVLGVQNLLAYARKSNVKRFVQISTDEVYGSIDRLKFTEKSPLNPSSPYSASKASADLLCLAAHKTYGQDVVITRCSNNYGRFQHKEKLIPMVITNALKNNPIPVYGDGENVRDWIHVDDHCAAIFEVMTKGKAGEVYNIGADCEIHNIDLIKQILDYLGKPHSLIRYVPDRLGHDRRYAIDSSKIYNELGWQAKAQFNKALGATINWYLKSK